MTDVVNETNTQKIKHYPVLDLLRFIAALLVIFIHIFPEGSTTSSVGLDASIPILIAESFVYPILRVAVPTFFVISSFLLFKKIQLNPQNKWRYVGLFSLRLLFLYLFWFVITLPIAIKDITGFVSIGDTHNLIRYFVLFIFKGAPRGFWFLVSLTLSVLITSLCESKKSLKMLLVIAIIMYIYGCFNSAYFGLFTLSDDPFSRALFTIGDYLELYMSHLQALLFVVLGKIFALHDNFKIKGNIVFIILSFLLMAGELFLTLYFDIFRYADAFFFLPIFIFFFMNKMLEVNIENESFARICKKLKKVGSFSYLFHVHFFYYLYWILDATNHNIVIDNPYFAFIFYFISVLLAFALQTLFEYLSKYGYLRFLKYSY